MSRFKCHNDEDDNDDDYYDDDYYDDDNDYYNDYYMCEYLISKYLESKRSDFYTNGVEMPTPKYSKWELEKLDALESKKDPPTISPVIMANILRHTDLSVEELRNVMYSSNVAANVVMTMIPDVWSRMTTLLNIDEAILLNWHYFLEHILTHEETRRECKEFIDYEVEFGFGTEYYKHARNHNFTMDYSQIYMCLDGYMAELVFNLFYTYATPDDSSMNILYPLKVIAAIAVNARRGRVVRDMIYHYGITVDDIMDIRRNSIYIYRYEPPNIVYLRDPEFIYIDENIARTLKSEKRPTLYHALLSGNRSYIMYAIRNCYIGTFEEIIDTERSIVVNNQILYLCNNVHPSFKNSPLRLTYVEDPIMKCSLNLLKLVKLSIHADPRNLPIILERIRDPRVVEYAKTL